MKTIITISFILKKVVGGIIILRIQKFQNTLQYNATLKIHSGTLSSIRYPTLKICACVFKWCFFSFLQISHNIEHKMTLK